MRKYLAIILAILISLVLVACEGETVLPEGSLDPTASEEVSVPPQETDKSRERAAVDNAERQELFRSFLSENYTELSELMFGGIAGIGFADLDCDGGMEMILFDAGASAAMGVQFFDIVDGQVECISANLVELGERFGGDYFTETYVNTSFFDDFRLMADNETGERFFYVESANGALDFSYTEHIRFGVNGEVLTVTSLCYKYEDYDEQTEEVISSNYKVAGAACGEDDYTAAVKAFTDGNTDQNLELAGVFAWEDETYTDGVEGLLAMADKALSLAKDQTDLFSTAPAPSPEQ